MRRGIAVFCAVLFILSSLAFAGEHHDRDRHDRDDRRNGHQHERNVYEPAKHRHEHEREWRKFNKEFKNKWKIVWNDVTGTPHKISGYFVKEPHRITERNVQRITHKILKKYRDLLQIDMRQLEFSKADFVPSSDPHDGSGTWYVYYVQAVEGVPVPGGSVRLVIRGQKVVSISSDFYPGITELPVPVLSDTQAAGILGADLQKLLNDDIPAPDSVKSVLMPVTSDGLIRYRLAWQVTTPVLRVFRHLIEEYPEQYLTTGRKERVPAQWRYTIDAETGEILSARNIIMSEDLSGTVSGQVYPTNPLDPQVQELLEGLTVSLTQGGLDYTADTDVNGDYLFTGLTTDTADLEAHLKGPHVQVHNTETPDPDATHTATVFPPALHDLDWSVDDPSPEYVETNAFYHLTFIRNWFSQGAPYDVIPVSPDGPSQDYVRGYVRDGDYCNAYAAPGAGTVWFGSGYGHGSGCEDLGLCADIIYHEYGHLVIGQIYSDAGVQPNTYEFNAMHEGFADYFGLSITDDPENGNGCSTFRNIDTPDTVYPDNVTNESHNDGTIIAGAVWDLRAALGRDYVDNLAFRALKHVPSYFSEYLGALIEEDDDPLFTPDPAANNDPSDGTPNINDICNVFFDVHGIYHSYCANRTQEPVAIITTPSPIKNDYNVYDSSTTSIAVTGTAQGSLYGPLQSFTLDYAREDDLDTWLTTGVTLAGGGAVPVDSSDLGSLDITGLTDGYYLIRLTVLDTVGNTSVAVTAILIDRTYMNGWPKKLDTYFLTSPVAVDFDPAAPGLEIVARERWGAINVWHADGTSVTGWPIYVDSWPVTPPTVADIDNDGTMEVLAASGNTIAVFNNNGTTRPGWPQVCSDDFGRYMTPVVYDLNGDGTLEIVAGTEDGTLCAWNDNGSMVPGWPVSVTGTIVSPPAIGDLDGDGSPEIVVPARWGSIYVFAANGLATAGWPQGSFVYSSPSLADLDGDGTLEIVAVTPPNVSVWHYDGSPVLGWPQSAPNSNVSPLLAIGDVNSDGSPEIILQANATIYAWTADGSLLPSAPFDICGVNCATNPLSPAAGDVDGNGTTEIVATRDFWKIGRTWQEHALYGSRTANKFFAFDQDGIMAPGFPKYGMSKYSPSSPIIADIDQDGSTELMVAGFGVHIWDLPGTYSEDAMEWPEYRHDPWHTGLYGSSSPAAVIYVDSSIGSDSFDGSSPVFEGGTVGPKQTIQAGIDAASTGQTCQVAAGTYTEMITMKEGILLKGAGAVVTVIDGGGAGPVVTGANDSLIDGFTVTGASPGGFPDASGIYCEGTSMTIKNNIISNIAVYPIFVRNASPLIQSNTIIGSGNNGIYNSDGSGAIIRNNLIYASADSGIYCLSTSDSLRIENNTIVNNAFGLDVQNSPSGIAITNNIIAGNTTGIYVFGNAPSMSYNDVWNNIQNYSGTTAGPGDISLDPLFVDPAAHDYYLQAGSPCIDAGTDVGQPYSGAAPDMGAFEF